MTDSTDTVLPPEFSDLAPLSEWILPNEPARFAKRMASTMGELQAFYDAAFVRFEDAAIYLERFDVNDIPDDARNLLWLYCSLVTVSFAVECWRQPNVPDSGSSSFDEVFAPAI